MTNLRGALTTDEESCADPDAARYWARHAMKNITPNELQALLANQPDLAVLDVRTPLEFAQVHVPQARNVPLHQLGSRDFLETKTPVYLLCRSGGRATNAANRFIKAGVDDVVVVEGGTLAWIDAGLPVERGAVKAISLERQVRIVAGSLVLIGLLLARLVHPYFIGLSAFVGAGLVFAGVTDFCGMGILLSKMRWNKAPEKGSK